MKSKSLPKFQGYESLMGYLLKLRIDKESLKSELNNLQKNPDQVSEEEKQKLEATKQLVEDKEKILPELIFNHSTSYPKHNLLSQLITNPNLFQYFNISKTALEELRDNPKQYSLGQFKNMFKSEQEKLLENKEAPENNSEKNKITAKRPLENIQNASAQNISRTAKSLRRE